MYIDVNGNNILLFYNYDSKNPERQLINLSKQDIQHDFRDNNVVENMIWCIQIMQVEALEDYEIMRLMYLDVAVKRLILKWVLNYFQRLLSQMQSAPFIRTS